ncbi:amino acid ABC transporter permease [Ligilactobacillus sp. WILCCON 0076]|uniref:Amino acid ABC transporter permease n=1 Tax=Ligilactobacillus ubinensis TaxID=2876789 RepID=A0A9X2FH79_9LACO|nr:amino acid ABC transporter permease [Ligilactobacillus ubinensis]MCP0885759.1 amino acid ABC transporter permease [Ligilactobacillus ubinensis]
MKELKIIETLLKGLPNTLILIVGSFVFATLVGVLIAWLYLRKHKGFQAIAKIYLGISRGTPPLLMLLVAYYGLPKLLEVVGININDWSKMFFAIAGLSIGWGAYLAEAFRSAYLAVDKGQHEAGLAIGLSNRHIFLHIMMPQTMLIALPNIENLLIGLIKATSLVYVIGITDMYNVATDLSNINQGVYQLSIFVTLALIYWFIVLIVEFIFRLFRNHFKYVTV